MSDTTNNDTPPDDAGVFDKKNFPKQKRAKGPNKFRLAEVLNPETDLASEDLSGDFLYLKVNTGLAFKSTSAVREAASQAKDPGNFATILIRDRFTVDVEIPEPVPVVTVKSVKV